MGLTALITPIHVKEGSTRQMYLGSAIRSGLNQDCNIVHIIIDDGSTIDIKGTVNRYGSKVRYFRREALPYETRTASHARNLGLGLCFSGDAFLSGEMKEWDSVAFLDSDDLLPSHSISMRRNTLGNGFVYGSMLIFDQATKMPIRLLKASSVNNYDKLSPYKNPHCLSMMWNREFLKYLHEFTISRFGPLGQNEIFDPQLSHGEDTDVAFSSLEAAKEGHFSISRLPDTVYLYRVQPDSITHVKLDNAYSNAQVKRRMMKHFGKREYNMEELMALITSDPPWSWFTWLPPNVKRRFRPIRDDVKKIINMPHNRRLQEELNFVLSQTE